MSFKENYKNKVNTAGKYVLPVVLTLIGIALGALLLGAIGEGIWICLSWCFQRIWKIAVIGIIIFIVVALIAAKEE